MIEGLPCPPTAVLIPAERPKHFAGLVENIAATTPEPHQVYWTVGTDVAADELARLKQHYWKDEGSSWGRRLNFMVKHTTEPFLFLCADDVRFHDGWLGAAHRCMGSMEGVVFVNDLHNPAGTLALISRHYIDTEGGPADEPGAIIHPGYRHCYSDTELLAVAQGRGKHRYCPDSIVEHMHPAAGKAEWDDVYEAGSSAINTDRALYQERSYLWGQ